MAATVATFHDVLGVLGVVFILNKEIALLVVTALLARGASATAADAAGATALRYAVARGHADIVAVGNEVLLRGVWRENPVLVQMLGLCSTLAVTNTRGSDRAAALRKAGGPT